MNKDVNYIQVVPAPPREARESQTQEAAEANAGRGGCCSDHRQRVANGEQCCRTVIPGKAVKAESATLSDLALETLVDWSRDGAMGLTDAERQAIADQVFMNSVVEPLHVPQANNPTTLYVNGHPLNVSVKLKNVGPTNPLIAAMTVNLSVVDALQLITEGMERKHMLVLTIEPEDSFYAGDPANPIPVGDQVIEDYAQRVAYTIYSPEARISKFNIDTGGPFGEGSSVTFTLAEPRPLVPYVADVTILNTPQTTTPQSR